MSTQKKPAQRLSPGLAGSSLPRQTPAERMKQLREERAAARLTAKESVKFPLAERIADDKELKKRKKEIAKAARKAAKQAEKEAKKADRMPSGKYMTDAPQGKGLIVTGGYDSNKITSVVAAHDAAEDGHRRVKSEGTGQRPGRDSVGDKPAHGFLSGTGEREVAPIPLSKRTFKVKANRSGADFGDDDEKRAILAALVGQVLEVVPDSDIYRCNLCGFTTDWESIAVHHFETSVEDELREYTERRKKAKEDKEAWTEFLDVTPMPFVMPVATQELTPGPHAQIFIDERNKQRHHAKQVAEVAEKSANGSSR
jgi:hypothetical protein